MHDLPNRQIIKATAKYTTYTVHKIIFYATTLSYLSNYVPIATMHAAELQVNYQTCLTENCKKFIACSLSTVQCLPN